MQEATNMGQEAVVKAESSVFQHGFPEAHFRNNKNVFVCCGRKY